MNRSSADLTKFLFILLGFIVMFLALAWWQFTTIGPTSMPGQNPDWWKGLLHGIFAMPNFIFSAFSGDGTTIFQGGSGGWYAFWWLFGAGGILGSSKSKH